MRNIKTAKEKEYYKNLIKKILKEDTLPDWFKELLKKSLTDDDKLELVLADYLCLPKYRD